MVSIFLLISHFGEMVHEDEEADTPTPEDLTSLLNVHPAMNKCPGKVPHVPKHRRCAAHTLNLVATEDVDKGCTMSTYCQMATAVFGKLKLIWNKHGESTRTAEVIKKKLGKYFPVPNTTHWNSPYDAMKFVDEAQKDNMEAVCDAVALPRLQKDDQKCIGGVLPGIPEISLTFLRHF
ncbi:zinc finger BED domain-containing protein 4 [Ixodes scapularis]